MSNNIVSPNDLQNFSLIRKNITDFLSDRGSWWGTRTARLLDVAPQIHSGARPFFSDQVSVETLDIDPQAGADYCADLCETNLCIPNDHFDIVVCTEVLEHTLNPFSAVAEIYRILKPGGYLLASCPFNFRIHGPLPDCWRFTEHGWRALLAKFVSVEIKPLEDPDRFLMPIHYTVTARKQ